MACIFCVSFLKNSRLVAKSSVIDSHSYMFFNLFDPIKVSVNLNDYAYQKFYILNKQFIFQLVYFIIISFYGVFGLEDNYDFKIFNLKHFKSSPYVFTHQVYPKSIWEQIDIVIIYFGIPFMILFFTAVVFTQMIDPKYWMYINGFTNQTTFSVPTKQGKPKIL